MVSDILWTVLFLAIAAGIILFFVRMVKKSMTCGCGCSGCSGGSKCQGCAELKKKNM